MSEEKKTELKINDKDYILEDMTEEQQMMVQHIQVAEQRLAQAKFDADHANVTKDSFINMLTQQLENPVEDAELVDEAVDELN
tara:strand:+ start:148 stop:396 length:249 start_codon:yes stop_codon:yes gene_type:complete